MKRVVIADGLRLEYTLIQAQRRDVLFQALADALQRHRRQRAAQGGPHGRVAVRVRQCQYVRAV